MGGLRERALPANIDAMPHQVEYLSLCSFFVIPMSKLLTNYFPVHIGSIENSQYGKYRAWQAAEIPTAQKPHPLQTERLSLIFRNPEFP